ncbi:MAG: polysaccharide biosynthesis/export family protein [Candidatus Sulfotelmatobacter sp.]|jgi:polysaccharide export outer membrane protein
MEFCRIGFARSRGLLAVFVLVVLLWGAELTAWAQQDAASTPAESAAPAVPVPQTPAASGKNTDSEKAAPSASAASPALTANDNTSQLKLGSGDLLEVSVYNVPELTTKTRIGNAGDVYLPLIDYAHVGGLTVEEAQALIQKRLEDGGFVHNAHVTIFVDESASQGVTILGEVAKPGLYPALGDRRLYDMISVAGGFTSAAARKISVIRQNTKSGSITLNLPRNLADDLQDNIEILPGDTITVPKAPIIYVVGDVGRPAGFLVDNGTLTVLEALALAGGTNHTAKLGGVRIIHKGPAGMTETRVPLKKMLEAKAPDITMQADDILFVPLSGARVAASAGFNAAVAAGSGLAILAVHP